MTVELQSQVSKNPDVSLSCFPYKKTTNWKILAWSFHWNCSKNLPFHPKKIYKFQVLCVSFNKKIAWRFKYKKILTFFSYIFWTLTIFYRKNSVSFNRNSKETCMNKIQLDFLRFKLCQKCIWARKIKFLKDSWFFGKVLCSKLTKKSLLQCERIFRVEKILRIMSLGSIYQRFWKGEKAQDSK